MEWQPPRHRGLFCPPQRRRFHPDPEDDLFEIGAGKKELRISNYELRRMPRSAFFERERNTVINPISIHSRRELYEAIIPPAVLLMNKAGCSIINQQSTLRQALRPSADGSVTTPCIAIINQQSFLRK